MQISIANLLPYSGKTVKITCQNPSCKAQQKLNVPLFQRTEEIGLKTVIEEQHSNSTTKIEQPTIDEFEVKTRISVLKNEKTDNQMFLLKSGVNTIGRYVDTNGSYLADFAIKTKDSFISKKHCQINVIYKNDRKDFVLKDLESTNGTYLNNSNTPLDSNDEVYLKHGDTIILGDTTLVFEILKTNHK